MLKWFCVRNYHQIKIARVQYRYWQLIINVVILMIILMSFQLYKFAHEMVTDTVPTLNETWENNKKLSK